MVTRRQETERRLSGRNSSNPLEMSSAFRMGPSAPLSVGGAQNARAIRAPDLSTADRLFQGLAEFGSKTIRDAAKVKYNKQVMEGAMAYQQGKSAEDYGGFNKRWQLEGYRTMDASTSAAALLSAQKQEIVSGLYEADPDAYREMYANRMEMATAGKDDRTIDLMSEQMMKNMPTLVAEHTAQHMQYLERRAVSSLETSIDVMSRNEENIPDLLAFARGEAGSEGLSTEARRSAVISGVARAYDNNNPAAYAILEQEGVLGELSSQELATVRAAQGRWESRARSEYDAEFFEKEQALLQDIKAGEYLDPTDAINAVAELYESRGLTITAAEAENVYSNTDKSNEVAHGATVLELETARSQQDYNRMADLTGPYIVHIESRGNRNAVSPTGAKSEWQVMDYTNADPGFGVEPARNDSLAERARVGRDYWKAMVNRYNGDLEAAAVAYNAGPGNADEWLKAGRNFEAANFTSNAARVQAKDYVRKFNAQVGGERYAERATNRYAAAEQEAMRVRESLAVDLYAATQPQFAELDDMRINGQISDRVWRDTKQQIRDMYGMEKSKAAIDADISVNRAAIQAEAARAKAAADAATDANDAAQKRQYSENVEIFRSTDEELQAMLNLEMERISGMPDYDEEGRMLDPAQKVRLQTEAMVAARDEYNAARTGAARQLGIEVTDLGMPETTRRMITTVDDALNKAMDSADELNDIRVASARGTLDTLPQQAKDRAWEQFQQATTRKYADLPPAENEQEASQRMARMDEEFSAWYAKTGYVPDEVREQASAALTAQLVTPDGEPSEYAVEAVQDYIRLKGSSKHAADNYLNPEAQVVAEAILSITGGRPETIPMTIQRYGMAWSSYGSSGQEQRDPNFLERSETRRAIDTNIRRSRTRGFFSSIFGGRGAGLATTTGAGPEAERLLDDAIRKRVMSIHAVNPNIPPQHVVDLATDSIQQQMAVVDGELLLDPTGRDIYNDVFGPEANNYRNDPTSIETALKGYLNSRTFQDEMGAMGMSLEPDPGFFERMGQSLVEGMSMGGVEFGSLQYDVEAVGQGNLIINFSLSDDEMPISVPIRLQDVGTWWNTNERQRRVE